MRCAVFVLAALAAVRPYPSWSQSTFAADDPYQKKTLHLRSGPITLEPTQAPPSVRSRVLQPPASPTPGSAQPRARWLDPPPGPATPMPAEEPPPTGEPARPTSGPLGGDRAIVNFERRVTATERDALLRKGIEVGEYLGGNAYIARLNQKTIDELVLDSKGINTIQHIVAFNEGNAHLKIDPSVQRALQAAAADPPAAPDIANVIVQVWPEADLDLVKRELEPHGTVKRIRPFTHSIEMFVQDADSIKAISMLNSVKYIAPSFEIKAQNTHVIRNLEVDIASTEPHLLSGKNVRVGIWDEGHIAANHPSFAGRLSLDLALEGLAARTESRHATHVAGTIAGSGEYAVPVVASEDGSRMREGQIPAFGKAGRSRAVTDHTIVATPAPSEETSDVAEPRYPGVASSAEIVSFQFNEAAEKLIKLLTQRPDAIDVVNNSWNIDYKPSTCNQLAAYGLLWGPEFDGVVSGRVNGQSIRRIPIVISAGNNRNDGICGLSTASGFPNYRTVAPPGTAKNVITVGAIDSDSNEMTEFSGWGPTNNGRVKPDVVAPGCRRIGQNQSGIVSTVPATGIGRSCGTSMAAPAVTGVIALLIAVYPANIYAFQHQELLPAPPLLHVLRLPLQLVFILWAFWHTRPDPVSP